MTKDRWENLSSRADDSWYDDACHGWRGEEVLSEKYPYAVFMITMFILFVAGIILAGKVIL